ncbi:MAG: hypothetical protein F6K34_01090 [Okeania sp. SIO4D6]|nr:hypothetical protein [Okeania sp. SIO4D6]
MDLDFINSRSILAKYPNVDVYNSPTTPSNPSDGSLWFDNDFTNSFAGQPWVYVASLGIWLSDPVLLPIPKITLTTSNEFQYFPVRTYGTDDDRIYIQYFSALVFNNSSTAHTQTNYWSLTLKGYLNTGAIATFWDSPSNTGFNFSNPSGLPGNLPRHIGHNVNTFITGRAWSLGLDFVRNGNAPSIDASATILFRYVKP